jgi:hypothetical protein
MPMTGATLQANSPDDEVSLARQLAVYAGCVFGILVGPYAVAAAAGTYPTFVEMFGSPIKLFFAVVFGFVLTAFLFKTLLSAKTPILVQIGFALVAGFGSGKLVPKAVDFLSTKFT